MESDQLKAYLAAPWRRLTCRCCRCWPDAGLRIFVEQAQSISFIASVLAQARKEVKSGGRGPVTLCLLDPSLPGEVDIDLHAEFPVNPQIKGALKSLVGVVEVEEV